MPWLLVALLALFAVLVAAGGVFGWMQLRTYHLATVQSGVLYRSGNRSVGEFANAARAVHPKTVVTLIDDHEFTDPRKPQFRAEAAFCQAKGITQIRIPVPLGGWPDSQQIRQFLTIVEDPTKQPVLVHCAQGVRRTGMFVAAYQETDRKLDPEQAKSAIVSFGHGDATVDDIKTFIDRYDPGTRTVAALPTTAASHE